MASLPDNPSVPPPDLKKLAALLEAMGCPAAKTAEMAALLDKRAGQLAQQNGRTHAEALQHVLQLMRQGWSAREKGFS